MLQNIKGILVTKTQGRRFQFVGIILTFSAIAAALLVITGGTWANRYYVHIEFSASRDANIQLYWDDGGGLRETQSSIRNTNASASIDRVIFSLPLDKTALNGIRIAVRFRPDEPAPGTKVRPTDEPIIDRSRLRFMIGSVVIRTALGFELRRITPEQFYGFNDLSLITTSAKDGLEILETRAPGAPEDVVDPRFEIFGDRVDLREPWRAYVMIGVFSFCLVTLFSFLAVKTVSSLLGAGYRQVIENNYNTIIAFVACMCAIWYMLGGGAFGSIIDGGFSNVMSSAAMSLVNGNFYLPVRAAGNEAFLIDGRSYVYYGYASVIIRILFSPFLSLDKDNTKLFFLMLASVNLLMICATVRHIASSAGSLYRHAEVDRATALAILSLGCGTTFLVVFTRDYIYHEAILYEITTSVAIIYLTLRILDRPDRIGAAGLFLVMVLVVHSRLSSLLFAGAIIGVGGLVVFSRTWRASLFLKDPRIAGLLAGAAGLMVALGLQSGLDYARWGKLVPGAPPLEYHYGHPIERLAHFGGNPIRAENLVDRTDRYFLRILPKMSTAFPYIDFNNTERTDSFTDIMEPYVSFVPGLCGAIFIFLAGVPQSASRLWGRYGMITAAALLLILPMLLFVGVTFRYIPEMTPAMLLPTAIGALVVVRSRWRMRLATGLVGLAIIVQVGFATRFMGEYLWGIPQPFIDWYMAKTRTNLGDIYLGALGTPGSIQAMRVETSAFRHWFHPFPEDSMRNHIESGLNGLVLVHEPSGIKLPVREGNCPLTGRPLWFIREATLGDVPWLAMPMAATGDCSTLGKSAVEQHRMIGVDVSWMAAPITKPKDPSKYMKRFGQAVAELCQSGNCMAGNWDRVQNGIDMMNGFHVTVEAACMDKYCQIYRYTRTSRFHGLMAATIVPVAGEVVYYYRFFPLKMMEPFPEAAFISMRRIYQQDVAAFLQENVR